MVQFSKITGVLQVLNLFKWRIDFVVDISQKTLIQNLINMLSIVHSGAPKGIEVVDVTMGVNSGERGRKHRKE
jgi:hypothetical protein